MKKQFLFLAMITLAFIFAGITDTVGQLPLRSTPNPVPFLSCATTSLPLHPMPGIPYTYRMDGTTGEEDVSIWTWWATKDTSFISAGGGLNTANMLTVTSAQLIATSANYGPTNAGAADTVSITWTAQVLALTDYQGDFYGSPVASQPSPTFVVGYGDGQNCADNIEVFEINPVPAFIIDIANIAESGQTLDWEVDTAECVDVIRSARYDQTKDSLIMNYGTDTLYFEVVASNFVTSWTPYFQITAGLSGSQTADIGIAASYSAAQSGTWITGTSEVLGLGVNDSTSFGGVELTATNPDDVVDGVSVFVRVIIHNNTYESLTSQTFTLAANGRDLTNQWDMEDADCADPATADYDLTDDLANQIIRPRPTITPDLGPMGEPSTVDPETIIDKQRN